MAICSKTKMEAALLPLLNVRGFRAEKQMKYTTRQGNFLIGMVLATVLFLVILNGLMEMRTQSQEITEQNYAIQELAEVGQAVRSYLEANRSEILQIMPARGAAVNVVLNSDTNTTIQEGITHYLNTNKSFAELRNIWGDAYHAVFIRSRNPAEVGDGVRGDILNCYVYVGGTSWNKKHLAGTETGDKWLHGGMRRAAFRGGAHFGFIEGGVLRSGGFETSLGLENAHNGDLAYLVAFNKEDLPAQALMRYPTGRDEDNTMHADMDMNDNTVLNVRYLETQSIETGSIRFDPMLYDSPEQAENSCRNNWFFINNRNTKTSTEKLLVDSHGDVYTSWDDAYHGNAAAKIGTLGMNDAAMANRVQNNDASVSGISNVGRVYYVSPRTAHSQNDPNRLANTDVFAVQSQLAVCRVINGTQTLAYIGDNRTEDKIAFVVSAVDGDHIPPFYCPGQDVNVQGGGRGTSRNVPHIDESSEQLVTGATPEDTLFNAGKNTANTSNNQGISPRLFVMPQMVSSGHKAFPIQGIKAWAETVNTDGTITNGWIVRLNALIDVQYGRQNQRTYWVGNIPRGKQIANDTNIDTVAGDGTPGYKSTDQVEYDVDGTTHKSFSYLRAVVIGVCSGKASPF